MTGKRIDVTAYAGYRGEEAPRAFFLDNEKVDVIEVVRSWREEERGTQGIRRFFLVKGGDGHVHRIYYDERSGDWYLG